VLCECRPTPDILWFAESPASLISSSAHYRLSASNQSLTISSVQPADERHYGCQATNTEGATEPVYQQVRVGGQLIVICYAASSYFILLLVTIKILSHRNNAGGVMRSFVLSFILSVSRITHECVNGCPSNMISLGTEWPSRNDYFLVLNRIRMWI